MVESDTKTAVTSASGVIWTRLSVGARNVGERDIVGRSASELDGGRTKDSAVRDDSNVWPTLIR